MGSGSAPPSAPGRAAHLDAEDSGLASARERDRSTRGGRNGPNAHGTGTLERTGMRGRSALRRVRDHSAASGRGRPEVPNHQTAATLAPPLVQLDLAGQIDANL